jgi:hypothetical protein
MKKFVAEDDLQYCLGKQTTQNNTTHSVCLCVCVCVCIHIYTHIHYYIYIYIYIYIYTYAYISLYKEKKKHGRVQVELRKWLGKGPKLVIMVQEDLPYPQ